MRAQLLIAAESLSIDARRGSVSLFHIFEQIVGVSFPMILPQMSVIMMLERSANEPAEPSDVMFRIVLNEQELYRGPVEARFGDSLLLKFVTDVRGIVIPQPGKLRLIVTFGDGPEQNPSEWPIPVINISQPIIQTPLPLSTQPSIEPTLEDNLVASTRTVPQGE